jgi:hypothetical protein
MVRRAWESKAALRSLDAIIRPAGPSGHSVGTARSDGRPRLEARRWRGAARHRVDQRLEGLPALHLACDVHVRRQGSLGCSRCGAQREGTPASSTYRVLSMTADTYDAWLLESGSACARRCGVRTGSDEHFRAQRKGRRSQQAACLLVRNATRRHPQHVRRGDRTSRAQPGTQ